MKFHYIACVGLILIASALPAQANLVISPGSPITSAGGTGSFDILLLDTGGTYQVGSFTVEASVAADSGVHFTSVTTETAFPYIFGTQQSNAFSSSTFPNTDFTASDTDLSAPDYTTVALGTFDALAHVTFAVDPGTSAGVINIYINPQGSSLSDSDGNAIPYTTGSGTITVTTPEPASFGVLCMGCGAMTMRRRSRT